MKSPNISDPLERLQRWYLSNCDGYWEHQYGIQIETLDNPGWTLIVDLEETGKADQPFEEIKVDYDSDENWIIVEKVESKLKGACGPAKLSHLLQLVVDWLEP